MFRHKKNGIDPVSLAFIQFYADVRVFSVPSAELLGEVAIRQNPHLVRRKAARSQTIHQRIRFLYKRGITAHVTNFI